MDMEQYYKNLEETFYKPKVNEEELKKRIEKAIEYMEENRDSIPSYTQEELDNMFFETFGSSRYFKELLSILKGEDDNETTKI